MRKGNAALLQLAALAMMGNDMYSGSGGGSYFNPNDVDLRNASPSELKLHEFTINGKTILAPNKKAAKKIAKRKNYIP